MKPVRKKVGTLGTRSQSLIYFLSYRENPKKAYIHIFTSVRAEMNSFTNEQTNLKILYAARENDLLALTLNAPEALRVSFFAGVPAGFPFVENNPCLLDCSPSTDINIEIGPFTFSNTTDPVK